MKIKPAERTGGVIVELGPKETQLLPFVYEETTPAPPVFKLRKILVPVDFSECTEKALFYAIAFVKQFDAELTLLHVLEASHMPATGMGAVPDVEPMDDANKKLHELRDKFAGMVRCNTVLRKGRVQYEIIEVARELGSDLIILSTHGRIGLKRVLMGSTTEKVVRHAGSRC